MRSTKSGFVFSVCCPKWNFSAADSPPCSPTYPPAIPPSMPPIMPPIEVPMIGTIEPIAPPTAVPTAVPAAVPPTMPILSATAFCRLSENAISMAAATAAIATLPLTLLLAMPGISRMPAFTSPQNPVGGFSLACCCALRKISCIGVFFPPPRPPAPLTMTVAALTTISPTTDDPAPAWIPSLPPADGNMPRTPSTALLLSLVILYIPATSAPPASTDPMPSNSRNSFFRSRRAIPAVVANAFTPSPPAFTESAK